MNTNVTNTVTVYINSEDVFARCTNETLYQAYSRAEVNPRGDAVVMHDDDKDMFKQYYAVALAELGMLLAKRMSDTADYASGTFNVMMHDDVSETIGGILKTHCFEFVVRKVLEQWYRADFGSEMEKLEIKHCLHYRRKPVRRRFGPLF